VRECVARQYACVCVECVQLEVARKEERRPSPGARMAGPVDRVVVGACVRGVATFVRASAYKNPSL
jgi:hypothetical protein